MRPLNRTRSRSRSARVAASAATLGTLALVGLCSCRQIVDLRPADSSTATSAVGSWHGPTPVDLGDVRDPTNTGVTGFYAYDSSSPLVSATAALGVYKSFSDFRLARSPGRAALVGGFFDGARFRALGRIYSPFSQGGSGWAGYGPDAGFLDAGTVSYLGFAAGIDPFGTLLSVFSDGALKANTAQSAHSSETAWGGYSTALGSTLATAAPKGGQPDNGYRSALAWDSSGHAYYAFVNTAGKGNIQRDTGLTSWYAGLGTSDGILPATLVEDVTQWDLLNDGLGVTAISLQTVSTTDTPPYPFTGKAIVASASTDTPAPFAAPAVLSQASAAADPVAFGSAASDQGDVVVAYIDADTILPSPPMSTTTAMLYRYRVYATVRGAAGAWSGATQLDDPSVFDPYTTTAFQDSIGTTPAGGIDWPTPAVAYVGGGRFLVAFALTDIVSWESAIYVRGYTVGSGWDQASQITKLDSLALPAAATKAFRFANDLKLVSDGQGNALLVAHVALVRDTGASVAERDYGFAVYRYASSGGWSAGALIPGSTCSAPSTGFSSSGSDRYFCWGLRAEAAMFPGGESVVVYPAPAASSGTLSSYLRLYAVEYHP